MPVRLVVREHCFDGDRTAFAIENTWLLSRSFEVRAHAVADLEAVAKLMVGAMPRLVEWSSFDKPRSFVGSVDLALPSHMYVPSGLFKIVADSQISLDVQLELALPRSAAGLGSDLSI